jgi:nicotinamide riboside kinase
MLFKIAVVGGECTGKTTLCEKLAADLPAVCVVEYLRELVDRERRVPLAHDQAGILTTQIEREAAAVAAARSARRWVVCDSAPIATAIYSEIYFGDRGLYGAAAAHHASYALTLLTDVDLAWEADGLQRDGPGVRADFHARIRAWLQMQGAPFVLVSGEGELRSAGAVAALRALESRSR